MGRRRRRRRENIIEIMNNNAIDIVLAVAEQVSELVAVHSIRL